MQAVISIMGRLFLVAIFLGSGMQKLMDRSGTIARMQTVNMPNVELMYLGAILFLLVGAISVLIGYRARFGALLLMTFLILVTWYFHAFWALPAPEKQAQIVPFLHNLGLFGALMMIIANGPGAGSVDGLAVRASVAEA